MKTQIGFISTLLLFAILNAETGTTSTLPIAGALSIANLTLTPQQAVAGSNVQISFQLYNTYEQPLDNVFIYLEGAYPLLNYSPVTVAQISRIEGGSTYGYRLGYNLLLPNNIPTGVYTLQLVATYQTTYEATTSGGVLPKDQVTTQTVVGYSVIPITIYVIGKPSISVSASVNSITPGQPFVLTLNLQNNGYDNAKNITVNIFSTNNFKAVGTSSFTIGRLPIGASISMPITMFANISIENSTYTIPISLKYYSESGKVYFTNTSISINSIVTEPDISISLLGSMPPMLYSGYNQSIQFAIANSGNGIARNITVTVFPGRNLNILSSVRKFFIPALLPGSSINEGIFVSANYTTSTNANLIINVTYYSSNYKQNFSKVFNKTIYIMPSAQFQITGVKTQAYPGATNVPVTLTIKNIGNEVAKEIQVSFQSIYPITPINSNAYIEELLPGEEANVTFVINVDLNGYPGNYPITIFETWKQPNGSPNQLYAGSNNYYIPVYNKPSSSSNSTLSNYIIITCIGLIVIGGFVYFRKKKEKATIKKSKER
jgi:hypothetical protein